MLSTLVKFPSKNRPRLFFETLTEYLADETVKVLVTLDFDDPALPKYLIGLEGLERVKVRVGHSKSKVAAINDGLAEEDFSLVIVAADDLHPTRRDYAKRISSLFWHNFPEGDGVLHTNDGHNGRVLNSIAILDRRWFDRFEYIYRPTSTGDGYSSVFCDDELQAVSEGLGRAVYTDEVIIRHDWIGSIDPDDLHRRNEAVWDVDKATFERRKAEGFP